MSPTKLHSEPLLRVVKRAERPAGQAAALRAVAVVLSIVAGGVFLLALGQNPLAVYGTMLSGAFRSAMAIQGTVRYAIPLCISALAVTLAFKMKFWNIGGEGQLIMGAVFASYFALYHANLPHVVLLVIMALAGALGGGLWALIPAVCKVRWGTNETLFTLMLNYIALYIVQYLRDGPWRDPESAGFSKVARFDKNVALDKLFGVHIGWVIALVLTVVIWVYLRRTKQGYEIAVVGESQDTARYAGIPVRRVVLRTMFLSGAVAGLCGMVQVAGQDMTLSIGVAGGVGFTAIIVAWLCQLHPGMIALVSLCFGVMEKGSGVVQSDLGLSADCADVLQGVILFFILASEFFVRYAFVARKKGGAR